MVSGINTGRFGWVYGQTNAELMSLTYGGSLGLGVQSPDNTLHVVGTSTVTSNAFVGGDLTVAGSINGSINFPAIKGIVKALIPKHCEYKAITEPRYCFGEFFIIASEAEGRNIHRAIVRGIKAISMNKYPVSCVCFIMIRFSILILMIT